MLKTGEPIGQQQTGGPTEPPPMQKRSLGRRILMFPLSRLLVAGLVFALASVLILIPVGFAAGFVAALQGVDASAGSESGLSSNAAVVVEMVLIFGVFALAGIVTLAFVGKVIEQRSLAEVGLGRRGLLGHTLRGFGIGTAMVLLLVPTCGAAVLLGLIPAEESGGSLGADYLNQVQEFGGVLGYLGLAFALACFVAVAEEIVFRGLLFRILEEWLGSWAALAVSAVLFGMFHLANFEDPTPLSVVSQTAGGVAFAAAYMLTRKLWLPIGIHLGWDFAIFASGPEALLTLSNTMEAPSDLSALIVSVPDFLLAVVLLTLVVRRGRARAPGWMRRGRRRRKEPYDIDESGAAAPREEKAADELAAL